MDGQEERFFPDVSSGCCWMPESAARYNAVNELLRCCPEPEPFAANSFCECRDWVDVCNSSDAVLPVYTAVALTPLPAPWDDYNSPFGFEAVPAVDESCLWGIVSSSLAPGEWGRAVVHGVTRAVIKSGRRGQKLRPTSAGLVGGLGGRGAILAEAWNGHPGVIGLDIAGATEYTGMFKVVPAADGCVIVNGADPENAVCGYTDVPGCREIPRTQLVCPTGYVTLFFTYGSDGYHATFENPGSACCFSRPIGMLYNGWASQMFEGSTIEFSREYFL